jgi:prepilin-type N-terminal cleavage/methylation domain-containing protein
MRGRRGFTLVEVVVVLIVLSVIAVAAVPAFLDSPQEDELTVATRRVEALFRLARDSAARGGRPVTVVIDSASGRVWLDVAGAGAGAAALPSLRVSTLRLRPARQEPGDELGLPAGVSLQLAAARARFTFAPTGAAMADSLLVMSPAGARLVTINPWTGDVVAH